MKIEISWIGRSARDDVQRAFGAMICHRAKERPIHPENPA